MEKVRQIERQHWRCSDNEFKWCYLSKHENEILSWKVLICYSVFLYILYFSISESITQICLHFFLLLLKQQKSDSDNFDNNCSDFENTSCQHILSYLDTPDLLDPLVEMMIPRHQSPWKSKLPFQNQVSKRNHFQCKCLFEHLLLCLCWFFGYFSCCTEISSWLW
jgi:hypothetical protein